MPRIMIALSNALFAEGIMRILVESAEPHVVELMDNGAEFKSTAGAFKPDVVLVDDQTLGCLSLEDCAGDARLLLLDTGLDENEITTAVVSKGIKGVLPATSTPALMSRAIATVARGDVWFDKMNVKSLLNGLARLKKSGLGELSRREAQIVELVGKGYKNKEIAGALFISEPTVKSHMQRIFKKLNVNGRPQLITYALKGGDRRVTA